MLCFLLAQTQAYTGVLIPFCRLWDLDGHETNSFTLRSPGVSVCWHPEDAFKVSIKDQELDLWDVDQSLLAEVMPRAVSLSTRMGKCIYF